MISVKSIFEQSKKKKEDIKKEVPPQEDSELETPTDDTTDENISTDEELPDKSIQSDIPPEEQQLGDQLFQNALAIKKAKEEEDLQISSNTPEVSDEEMQAQEQAEKQKADARVKARISEILSQDDDHQKTLAANQITSKVASDKIKKMSETISESEHKCPEGFRWCNRRQKCVRDYSK